MARVFAENPNVVLQELVDIAVEVCGADSAGVSLEERSEDGKLRYRWSAVAGSFVQVRRGITSRISTQSGAGFSGGGVQPYRGGLATEPISDGILIPWSRDSMRGRVWAVAYHSREAFHYDDQKLLTELADFATIAIRHRFQEQELRRRETDAAAATTANDLAHQINNPLQRLTNTMYLARQGGEEAQSYLKQACHDLSALAELVGKLLEKAGDRA